MCIYTKCAQFATYSDHPTKNTPHKGGVSHTCINNSTGSLNVAILEGQAFLCKDLAYLCAAKDFDHLADLLGVYFAHVFCSFVGCGEIDCNEA
mgnify:CR=1 FL=1